MKCEPARDWSAIFRTTRSLAGSNAIAHNRNFRTGNKACIHHAHQLPNYVVDVQSVDVFKVHLDQFWAQQEVMFDWTADLTGTGDRSEYTVESN